MLFGNTQGGYINPYKVLEDVKKLLREYLVTVRVPRLALYSEAEIRELGIPVSQIDGKIDKTDINNYETVMLSLERLLDIAEDGFPIRIKNRAMVPKITETLEECLEGLNYAIEESELKEKIKNFLEKVLDVNREYVEKKLSEKFKSGIEDDIFMDMNPAKPKIDVSKLEV